MLNEVLGVLSMPAWAVSPLHEGPSAILLCHLNSVSLPVYTWESENKSTTQRTHPGPKP